VSAVDMSCGPQPIVALALAFMIPLGRTRR